MSDEGTNIAQEHAAEQFKGATEDIKDKAKVAGAAAWDATKATYKQFQVKASDCARATDKAIHTSPYVALGFAFCIGLVIGAFATRTKVIEKE